MERINSKRLIIFLLTLAFFSSECSGGEKNNIGSDGNAPSGSFKVYVINNNLHTGIVIPVDSLSIKSITALENFKSYNFADIGWGEETFYQDPSDNFCLAAKAVLLPNPSVIRIEGRSGVSEGLIDWNDYNVMFSLSSEQFARLLDFIEKSFKKDNGGGLVFASKKNSGRIIFFKSVYRYYMFSTCNTWVAKALQSAGLDVSPFFVLTAGQLYDEIKNRGQVIKALK